MKLTSILSETAVKTKRLLALEFQQLIADKSSGLIDIKAKTEEIEGIQAITMKLTGPLGATASTVIIEGSVAFPSPLIIIPANRKSLSLSFQELAANTVPLSGIRSRNTDPELVANKMTRLICGYQLLCDESIINIGTISNSKKNLIAFGAGGNYYELIVKISASKLIPGETYAVMEVEPTNDSVYHLTFITLNKELKYTTAFGNPWEPSKKKAIFYKLRLLTSS